MFFQYESPLPNPSQIQVLTAADPDWRDKPAVPQPKQAPPPPPPSPGNRKGTRAANIADQVALPKESLSSYPLIRRS